MAVHLQPSDRENPFAGVSPHSLLHQTLGPAAASAAPETALQILFQSMAVKGSTKLFEDAQTITTSYASNQDLYAEAVDKAQVTNVKDHPQGRRPALGRKKARFSLKPIQCDSSANCGVHDIVDPQEYFSAVDQIQRAEEEMKKCMGFASDLAQLHPSPTVRNRRLGLLGRTASYKHHLSDDADATKAFKMSQEDTPGQRIPSPAKIADSDPSNIMHLETTEKCFSHSMGPKSERPGETRGEVFVSEKEKSVDDLLEKMFASFKEKNGDDGVELLHEKLRIKSRDLGKTSFREPDGFQRTNLRILKTTTTKRLDRSRLPEPILSTTTSSPHAVIANLQKRISLKDPLPDPYAMSLSDDEPYPGETMGHKVQSLSSSADITEGVIDDICTDGASTPVNVSGKRMSLVDGTHLSVHAASRTVSNKVVSDEVSVEEAPESYKNSADIIRSSNLENVVDAGRDGHSAKEANDLQASTSICCQLDTVVKDLTMEFMDHNDMEPLATPPNRNMGGNNDERINGSASSLVCDATVQEEATILNCVQSDTVAKDLAMEFRNHNDMEPLTSPPIRNMGGNISKRINASASAVGGDAMVQEEVNVTSRRKSLSRAKEFKESLRRVSRRTVVQNIGGSGNGGGSSFGRDTILQDKVNVMVQGEPVLQAKVSRDLASPQETFLPRNGHTEMVASLPEETTEVGLAGNMTILPEGTNEAHVSQEISGRARKRKAPISGQNKKKPTANRQSVSRRQSLADCGLTWKSGRRQSTRIKLKPVQHWCGEKVLYGRIHDSVISVIGVMVASPRADGKSPMLKVKSYLPNEYDELVYKVAGVERPSLPVIEDLP